MTKIEARAFLKKRILEIENRAEKEKQICKQLVARLQGARRIISYRADQYEVNLDSIWNHSDCKGIDFYFPRVVSIENKKIEFVKPVTWRKGAYGLEEPIGNEVLPVADADLSIVPALGFHKLGYRLGRGAGFYDRAFQDISPKKMIGIVFSELFSVDFPCSDYDIRVGELVSESTVLFF